MEAPSANHSWQLPLPFDLVSTIIDNILEDHDDPASTLRSLSATCYSLASVCRPMKFEKVTINTSLGGSALKPSQVQKFAALLKAVPEIINYINHLCISDATSPGTFTWAYLGDNDDTRYILTRSYFSLETLELDLHTRWLWIPQKLKLAFQDCFALPTLRKLTIGRGLVVPPAFSSFFKQVSELDVQGSSSGSPSADRESAFCTPQSLSFADTSQDGSSTVNLFGGISGLCFTNLKHLAIYTRSNRVGLLEIPLEHASSTLTDLEIHLSSAGYGGYYFIPNLSNIIDYRKSSEPSHALSGLASLDLRCLQTLKKLTICADAMPQGIVGPESLGRFMWLCTTLSTCADPNSIATVTILIMTRNMDLVKCFPWDHMNDVFGQSAKWPKLTRLDVQVNNENYGDVRRYKSGSMEEMIYPQIPALVHGDILRVCILDEHLKFWYS